MINTKKYCERLVDNLAQGSGEYGTEVRDHKGKLPRSLTYFDEVKMAIIRRSGWRQLSTNEFEFANGQKISIQKNNNLNGSFVKSDSIGLANELYDAARKIAKIELDWLTKDLPENERERLIAKGLKEIELKIDIEDIDKSLVPFRRIKKTS